MGNPLSTTMLSTYRVPQDGGEKAREQLRPEVESSKVKEMAAKDAPTNAIAPEHDMPVKILTVSYKERPLIKLMSDLPAELRVMILKEYLAMPNPIYVASKIQAYAIMPLSRSRELQRKYNVCGLHIPQERVCRIFLVSKIMYIEAMHIYFGVNTFNFESTDDFMRFAGRISPTCRWNLRKISIGWTGTSRVDAAKALRTFVGLRELKLDLVTLYRFNIGKTHVDASGNVVNAGLKAYAQKELLCLRGLTKVQIGFKDVLDRGNERPCTQADKDAFVASLQVLKLRQDEYMLQEQHAKDFPESWRRFVG